MMGRVCAMGAMDLLLCICRIIDLQLIRQQATPVILYQAIQQIIEFILYPPPMHTLHHPPHPLDLPQLTTASWKHKILFLETLSHQIIHQQLSFPPQQLQPYWPHLIKEQNLNVLSKAIHTLQLWVNTYGIRSYKVQKELIRTLIALSRMRKPEIDSNVISIVITLITRQKQQETVSSRVPLAVLSQSQFNSLNNPTFLVGYQSQTMQEEQNYKETQTTQLTSIPTNILLAELMDCMKGCQKYTFLLCLKMINSMGRDDLLSQAEFKEFMRQAEHIKEVIDHRKFTNHSKDRQIDGQLIKILEQLKNIQL